MSYSADEVLVAIEQIQRVNGKRVRKFEAAEGWRIVDVRDLPRDEVMIVMVMVSA